MNTERKLLVALLAVVASSAALAYTMSPGPQKGLFFEDRWQRTWFLRPSAVAVSKEVALKAKESLGKPLVFNVTKFDTRANPREYQDGTLTPDAACEAESSHVALTVTIRDETLLLTIKYTGPDIFIVRDSTMLSVFSEPTRISRTFKPIAAQVLLKQLVRQKEQPTLESGKKVTYELALAEVVERLGLKPGEHQLIATYFNDYQKVRVVCAPLGLETKENAQKEDSVDEK